MPRPMTPAAPTASVAFATLIRCDNPGLMELDGTNTWILQAPGSSSCVVVDPGPAGHGAHVAAVARGRRVELVLVTHGHLDHVGGLDDLSRRTGAPVRAFDPRHCRASRALLAGEEFRAGGLDIRVLHTPGHTSDSVSFVVSSGAERVVLSGDTILGRGTTLLSDDRSALRDYLDSLDRLAALGSAPLLPGHGPWHADIAPVIAQYREHRRDRLDAIRELLSRSGLSAAEADPEDVADVLYADTPAEIRFAAVLTVRAQLDYLRSEG